jgi:hypothetical protein
MSSLLVPVLPAFFLSLFNLYQMFYAFLFWCYRRSTLLLSLLLVMIPEALKWHHPKGDMKHRLPV